MTDEILDQLSDINPELADFSCVKIRKSLRHARSPLSVKDIVKASGVAHGTVQYQLKAMLKDNKVTRRRISYMTPESKRPASHFVYTLTPYAMQEARMEEKVVTEFPDFMQALEQV